MVNLRLQDPGFKIRDLRRRNASKILRLAPNFQRPTNFEEPFFTCCIDGQYVPYESRLATGL